MDWSLAYTGCFVLGLTVLGLSFALGHLGLGHLGQDVGGHDLGGHDASGHAADPQGHGPALPLFSPGVLAVLIGMFGAGGLLFHKALGILEPARHVPGAAAVSVGTALTVAWMMRQVLRVAESNGVASFQDLAGQDVEVEVSIRGEALGEIGYQSGGTRQKLIARSADGSDHLQGSWVTVVGVREGIAQVGPRGSRPAGLVSRAPGETAGKVRG